MITCAGPDDSSHEGLGVDDGRNCRFKRISLFGNVPEGLPKIAQAFKPGTSVEAGNKSRRDGRKRAVVESCTKTELLPAASLPTSDP